ncbi:hypothetical protein MIND_00780000 [Mycena indigotica]|uniref:Uncharacterized protein n=1 Tax=Mycena indigotica TaxID=2126181 RepID=A0A8H6W225_9AGAR|nr:uncharacterized protein MIND_00780000 [Mycena indigotica]KAF7302132.1 hypothetical protein MIND_00780000 [Mycena indigotica]
MIVVEPDPKAAATTVDTPTRNPSPPPPYVGRSTVPSEGELPSAFRPPSPSSFPHAHPHTNTASSGPTPLIGAGPDGSYAYYDPRSAYSLAQADRRAQERFWSAFGCAIAILIFLWTIGLLRFGN